MDLFCYFYLSFLNFHMFIAALWSPVGKGLASWISCMRCFLVFLSLLLYKTRAHKSDYKGLILIALVKSKKSDNLVTCNSCKSLLLHVHNFKVDKISDPLAYFLEARASLNLDLKHFSCRNIIKCSTCLVIYLLLFKV